jgi:hypothetical protein
VAKGLALRLRENPRVRRERVERVARALSMLLVRPDPADRRGVLFGRVVSQGLKVSKPNLDTDLSGTVLEAAAEAAIAALSDFDGIDVSSLRTELQRLRSYLPLHQQIGSEAIARMQQARAAGDTWKTIALREGLPVERVRHLLGAKRRGGSQALAQIALPAPEGTQTPS